MDGTPHRFVSGASAAFRGLQVATRTPQVRRTYIQLALALLGVSVVLDILGIWAIVRWTGGGGDTWWAALALILLRIAGIAIVLLAAPVIALFVINIAFPFLSERVFLAGLRTAAPARADELSRSDGLPLTTGMLDNLLRMLLFIGLSVATFAISLVPLVGPLAGPALQTYFAARALGWEMLDPYFDKLRLRFDEQHRFVRRHRVPIVGFGLPFSLLMAIPLFGPVLFGMAQAAAGVLIADVLEATDSTEPIEPGPP